MVRLRAGVQGVHSAAGEQGVQEVGDVVRQPAGGQGLFAASPSPTILFKN